MKYLVLLFSFFLLSACTLVTDLSSSSSETDEEITEGDRDVDYQAAFVVFTNNNKRDFTLPMFLEQSPRAYITARFPGVVQVKKAPTTWGQFFNSLPISLDNDCINTADRQRLCSDNSNTLKFFLNGNRVYDLLEREIQSGDKVLVSFGSESGVFIERQLSQIPAIN